MTAPTRVVTPALRVSRLIRGPGGRTAADLAQAATDSVAQVAGSCEAELWTLLAAAERACAGLPRDRSGALAEIYALARRGVGAGAVCGRPQMDETLVGLCDLAHDLGRQTEGGGQAVAVHLEAWRLILQAPAGQSDAALLEGLATVRRRFAGTPAQVAP